MSKRAVDSLFDFFSRSAVTFYPLLHTKGFVCPLCIRVFNSTSSVSRAHLWPEALGGRIFTLACRECNSRIGSGIEKHEVQRVKYFGRDRIPFRQKIDGVEGDTGGFLSIAYEGGSPTLILEMSESHSNPKALAEQNNLFENEGILQKQTNLVLPTGYDQQRAQLTYLHFAYMSLFHLAGYSWILSTLAKCIYQQLNNPQKISFPICLVPFTIEETNGLAREKEPILFEVMAPESLKGYFIATPALKHEGNQRTAIWLPKYIDDDCKFQNPEDLQGVRFSYRFLAKVAQEPGRFVLREFSTE